MLSATSTYVDAYVVMHWMNFIILHAKLPASHETVIRHEISTRTLKRPTLRSVRERERGEKTSKHESREIEIDDVNLWCFCVIVMLLCCLLVYLRLQAA